MKLLIDTETQEIEILSSSSFLELKSFLEQIEGGIGYTVISKDTKPNFQMGVLPLNFQMGGDLESTRYNESDSGYDT